MITSSHGTSFQHIHHVVQCLGILFFDLQKAKHKDTNGDEHANPWKLIDTGECEGPLTLDARNSAASMAPSA